MQLELLDDRGQATSKVDAPDTVFARDYNEALVHQIVVAFQANARQGTRAQKDRTMVKHSTKKPWRQKGTGRARAGMTSSPLWRGGGRIFPNSPDENFTHKVNKKMYRAGIASILSQLAREGRLAVVDSIAVDSPKTKALAAKFKAQDEAHAKALAERDELLAGHEAEIAQLKQQIAASTQQRANAAATIAEIQELSPEGFWKQPDQVINQMLHRLFGNRQLVILDKQIIGVTVRQRKRLGN